MNFSTLRLMLLAVVFAWAQVCCCQAWAMVGIASAQVMPAIVQSPSCCTGCPAPMGITEAETEPGESKPIHNHGDCAGCVPRLGWMPEGPSEIASDLIGVLAPMVQFAELPVLAAQVVGAGARGSGGRPPGERSEFLEAPTLVRMHCALMV